MTDRVVIRKGLWTPGTAPNGDPQLVRGAGQPAAAGLVAKPLGSLDLTSLDNRKSRPSVAACYTAWQAVQHG